MNSTGQRDVFDCQSWGPMAQSGNSFIEIGSDSTVLTVGPFGPGNPMLPGSPLLPAGPIGPTLPSAPGKPQKNKKYMLNGWGNLVGSESSVLGEKCTDRKQMPFNF